MKNGARIRQTAYDRSHVEVGIVHLGYGAFHRAHQAVYVDDYMDRSGDLRWGIAAVNLRAADSQAFRAASSARDGYALKTTATDGTRDFRLVRPHVAFRDWSEDPAGAEALLALPTVHVASITVTESGYSLKNDWTLDLDAPVIREELDGGPPQTVYAYLAGALDGRMRAGGGPITILCCDNMRENGHIFAAAFTAYVGATRNGALADWIAANVTFPCSMVDRITPRAADGLVAEVAGLANGHDLAPINAEGFTQWVLENKFAGPFPDLGQSGVQIVTDVAPYEEAKIRILNGGHTALCYMAALAGYSTFDEAMFDPALRAHIDGWELQEVLPGLTLDLPFDKTLYWHSIADRFGNAAIADQLERICMDGWSKMPIYVRPTLEACLASGITPQFGFDSIASWYIFARRADAGEVAVPYIEPCADELRPLLEPGAEPDFAASRALWGELPATYSEFVPGVLSAIEGMDRKWPV